MEPILLLVVQSSRDNVRPSRPEEELGNDNEEDAHFGGFTEAKEQTELVTLTLGVVETELIFDWKRKTNVDLQRHKKKKCANMRNVQVRNV